MDRSADNLLVQTMRQALDEFEDESPMLLADWIASVADPDRPSTAQLLADPETPLDSIVKAKDLYKLLRVMGQMSPLRRTGRRLYAASIAAALVHHGIRISDQSATALERGFRFLQADEEIPGPVREIVQVAQAMLTRLHTLPSLKPAPDNLPDDMFDGLVSFQETVRKVSRPVVKAPEPKRKLRRKVGLFQQMVKRRETQRLEGNYDPVLGEHFRRCQAYCPACRSVVEIRRRSPNRLLHLYVSAMTLGIWLPVWGVMELTTRLQSWRCMNCRRRIYQAMIT